MEKKIPPKPPRPRPGPASKVKPREQTRPALKGVQIKMTFESKNKNQPDFIELPHPAKTLRLNPGGGEATEI